MKNMKRWVSVAIISVVCCLLFYGVNLLNTSSYANVNDSIGVSVDSFNEENETTDLVAETDNITEENYTEEEIKQILEELKGDGFKNNPLRQEYECKVACLKEYGDALLANGLSENIVAQTLNKARRDLGIEYKDATPQPLRDYIYEVNIGRYGDKLGPTYEYLVNVKGSTDAQIIESASRPNSNIDKLLSGFEQWLRER